MTEFARAPAPYLSPRNDVARIMRIVVLALAPAALVHVVLFGPGLIVNIALATATALACEYGVLRLRGRDAKAALRDYSAVVMAVLLAFALPPLAAWWVAVIAAAFAIVVAKQLYGGIGYNTFNPAMAGYAVVLLSFPEQMTHWPAPAFGAAAAPVAGWGESLRIIAGLAPAADWDALTMASPLDHVRNELGQGRMLSEIMAPASVAGRNGWLVYQLAVVAGGVALLRLKIIRWHIPVAVVAGTLVSAFVLNIVDTDSFASPWFQLTAGATLLGAFFIATDPVSAATSNRGRLIYGFGIGALLVIIRTFGNFPDGVAFAVLLMNMVVPLIDYYSVPPAYGHVRQKDDLL